MAIKNTRTASLIRAGKIRLGAKNEKGFPKNMPTFRITTENGQDGVLEKIEKIYGKDPTELKIYFPRIFVNDFRNSLEWIYDDEYRLHGLNKILCHGDGEKAERKAELDENGKSKGKLTSPVEVDCTCELLEKKKCSATGELRLGIAGVPFTGYFQIVTHSWHAIHGLRGIIEMYSRLLGDKFFSTKFILYKESMMLNGYNQYIVKIKIDPAYAENLPQMEDLCFMLPDEEQGDEAIVEIPEGFEDDATEEKPKKQAGTGKGKNKGAEKQPEEPAVEQATETAPPEEEAPAGDEPPFDPDPVESEPAEVVNQSNLASVEVTDAAVEKAYELAGEDNAVELIFALTEEDAAVLFALQDNDVIPIEEINQAATDRVNQLMEASIETESQEEGVIPPEKLEEHYGFDVAQKMVSELDDINVLEAVSKLGSNRMKLVASRRLNTLKKAQAGAASSQPEESPKTTSSQPPKDTKSTSNQSTANTAAKSNTPTSSQTSKAPPAEPAKAAENQGTAKDTAKTVSHSEKTGAGDGVLGLKRDRLRMSVENYRKASGLAESVDNMISRVTGKEIGQLTGDELVAFQKKFKEATASGVHNL